MFYKQNDKVISNNIIGKTSMHVLEGHNFLRKQCISTNLKRKHDKKSFSKIHVTTQISFCQFRVVGTESARGSHCPPFLGRSFNPFLTNCQILSSTLLLASQIIRPSYGTGVSVPYRIDHSTVLDDIGWPSQQLYEYLLNYTEPLTCLHNVSFVNFCQFLSEFIAYFSFHRSSCLLRSLQIFGQIFILFLTLLSI